MKIKAYQADYSGCFFYRLFQPISRMQKAGIDITISDKITISDVTGLPFAEHPKLLKAMTKFIPTSLLEKSRSKYDLIVMQRQNYKESLINARYFQGQGKKVIYELDDWIIDIDKTNPCYEGFMNPESVAIIENFMRYADAVTVSTEYLAKLVSKYNQNIYVLPNSIDVQEWMKHFEEKQKIKSDGKVRIGYAGSQTHYKDVYMVRQVLPDVLKKNPNAVLKLIGFDFHNLFKEEFKGLENRIEFINWLPIQDYPKGFYDIDIGIAPLFYHEFNRAKSNIKFLEYSAMGIPTVATDIEPYRCIKDGETGYLIKANNRKKWVEALTKLIRSETLRAKIGMAAQNYVCEKYDIDKTWKLWAAVYQDVLKTKFEKKAA